METLRIDLALIDEFVGSEKRVLACEEGVGGVHKHCFHVG